jgi:serine/threonine-protein kinase HipA
MSEIKQNTLNVFWRTDNVGSIASLRNGQTLVFSYSKEWFERGGMPISFSLPLQREPFDEETSTNFFENFLPEDALRKTLAAKNNLRPRDTFGLLGLLGRECAGALCILPGDTTSIPSSIQDRAYKDITSDIERYCRDSKEKSLCHFVRARLSLAGAQDKLTVLYRNNRFLIPRQFAATTHILKPDARISVFDGLARNEHFCMDVARMLHCDVTQHELLNICGRDVLLVKRFDRCEENGVILRFHQEDFCQALGLAPDEKYERTVVGDRFEGFYSCVNLAQAGKVESPECVSTFFAKAAILNFIVGNTDGHAKNYSILYGDNGKARLAPLYDIVSTEVYDDLLDDSFAMMYGKELFKKHMTTDSLKSLAQDVRIPEEKFFVMAASMVTGCEAGISSLVNTHRQKYGGAHIYERIIRVVQKNCELLRSLIPLCFQKNEEKGFVAKTKKTVKCVVGTASGVLDAHKGEQSCYKKLKKKLAPLKNPTERVIAFLGVLGEILHAEGLKVPLVVGGAAVEIYTHGVYMSQDIDIKSDMSATMRILKDMGFVGQGRSLMYSEEFDLLVDWQGACLEEGQAAEERALTLESSDGQPALRLISIPDLVIDRLEAYKFGKDTDSLNWARVLLVCAEKNNLPVDEDVLFDRAVTNNVKDVLELIWETVSESTSCKP